jgi:hypothetical protein
MVKTLNIGGKERPVLFGNLANQYFELETGRSLLSLQESLNAGTIRLTDGHTLYYCALRAGEYAAKVADPEPYTIADVALWLDLQPDIEAQLQALQQVAAPVVEDDAKKKTGRTPVKR